MQSQEARRFLNPTTLARIGSLELVAKAVVEGFISGLHKSPYHGFSVEFAQYRQYMPGDDTKHIDWKVYGRTDRYYIKQFEEETNLNCYLLLDSSASMTYGSGELTKLEYASFLIASMAYFMAKQRDAVGLAYFDEKLHEYLPARSSPAHLYSILLTLERLTTSKITRMAEPLHQIAERLNKRGLVILISDLYEDEPETVVNALEHFRYDGHEVIVFHILDHLELEFEFERMTRMIRFVDSETDEEIITTPQTIHDSYVTHHLDFINHYKLELSRSDIDYNTIDTSTPLDYALSSYLAKREGLM
ncbi:MAG: DUF58 domain-containing protein [Candidatus Poribacteria bacterium]|nr:DUF58 domain-containing protein [Candidatus Poribacteria bacterium]